MEGGDVVDAEAPGRTDTVPRGTRWFVRAFLCAFVVCGLAGVEAWPLTGFRLFSHLRHEHAVGWSRTAMGADGRERAVDLAGLAYRQRSFVLVMKTFDARPKIEQDAMCRTWVSALHQLDAGSVAMRVYRVDRSLVPRAGDRPAGKASRTLLFTCTDRGAQIEGPGA